jgi:hypothetical protein
VNAGGEYTIQFITCVCVCVYEYVYVLGSFLRDNVYKVTMALEYRSHLIHTLPWAGPIFVQ